MVLLRSGYLALVLVLLGVNPASGSIIEGIEFTDLVSVDVPGGTNLLLTTSEDVYIFVPNGLFLDDGEIRANDRVIVGVGAPVQIVMNTPLLCAGPISCVTREFDLTSDVLLTILDRSGTSESKPAAASSSPRRRSQSHPHGR